MFLRKSVKLSFAAMGVITIIINSTELQRLLYSSAEDLHPAYPQMYESGIMIMYTGCSSPNSPDCLVRGWTGDLFPPYTRSGK
jgi:hypothetical protein